MAEDGGPGRGDVARTVPGGTTRNTGGVRAGIRDDAGRGTGPRRFGGRRWLIPVGFVLVLLALLLASLLPSA